MNPEKFVLSLFLKLRLLLEAAANPVERIIWQKRVYVLVFGILLVSFSCIKIALPALAMLTSALFLIRLF